MKTNRFSEYCKQVAALVASGAISKETAARWVASAVKPCPWGLA